MHMYSYVESSSNLLTIVTLFTFLDGKYSIRECFAQQLVSCHVSAGSQCHNENAEVVRNKGNNSKINIITTAVSVPLNFVSSINW